MKMSLARGRKVRMAGRFRVVATLGLAVAALFCTTSAHAFYPLGVYDENNVLRLATWKLTEMDTNGDGDVQAGEGVPLFFETGEWGFTDGEIDTVLQGFEKWGEVPTTYAKYRYAGKSPDPLEQASGLDEGSIDFINYVSFEFSDDGTEDADVLPEGTLGFAFLTYTPQDAVVTVEGRTYPISGAQMIEVDFVVDGTAYRDPEGVVTQYKTLEGVGVTLGGYGLGLNQSPLVNPAELVYDPDDPESLIGFMEDRVVAMPDTTGILNLVGTTSSMQADLLVVYSDDQTDATVDLAPDDIAGISYLYPRSSQTNFTEIKHEARTRSRFGAPTAAVEGAHIIAYCDVDNKPGTLRVPFVDTLSGLYESAEVRRGFFEIKGLFKNLYTIDGTLFEPTYVISCAPFEPLAEDDLADYDSTHGGPFISAGNTLTFDTLFSSEVFNEFGNLFGLENTPGGTPLVFDASRNRFVSADTGRTLTEMLPGRKPMFGDAETTCPYLIVTGTAVAKGDTLKGANFLRGLRDNYLTKTGAGLMLVDAYYQVAPSVSSFLRNHAWAFSGVRAARSAFEWALAHRYTLAFLALLLPAAAWLARRRSRAAAAALLVLFAVLAAWPASAQEIPMSTAKLVELSKDIVTGKVVSAESHFTPQNRIVTDVTVDVDDTVKGRLNKGGKVSFQVLGGQVGNIITVATGLASFKEGEEVLLFLKPNKKGVTSVTAGRRGKMKLETDPETKERFVVKPSLLAPPEPIPNKLAPQPEPSVASKEESKSREETARPATKFKDLEEKRIPLEDFKQNLRQIVQEQEAAAEQ